MPDPSSLQSSALRNALLAAASPIELATALIDPTTALTVGAGGYPVPSSLSATASIQLREHGPGRTARITGTWDLTCTYTITLTDTARGVSAAMSYDATAGAPANAAALVLQFIAAIAADGDVNALISAAVDADDDEEIVIRWRSPLATGIVVTENSGAVLVTTMDYESGTAILYCRSNPNIVLATKTAETAAANAWEVYAHPVSGEAVILGLTQGMGWRAPVMPCPSLAAMAFFVYDLAGHADDAASGDCTIAYRSPVSWIAPGVPSATELAS